MQVQFSSPYISMQSGINITMDGVSHCFRGTVTLVSGDNLGSHYIGGFKSPSGALRKCRHCMATSEDMSSEVCYYPTGVHSSLKLLS